MKQRKILAFTLVELMVAVVIIGVLGAVAGVNYKGYIRKTILAETDLIFNTLAKNQTSYFLENKDFRRITLSPGPIATFYANGGVGALTGSGGGPLPSPVPPGSPIHFFYL
ncbi:MAG: prepilin-type N-terminal cleavage/methylation domain-containing protein [Proteobacteria bacterium]|jgi:prepilin-type N-terminal cleavage/methylation domain-containing protein|nr:prepilin-type N-terminal cleavage/methylation domain-containing protein [Pseudomonadota bacterium]